MIVVVGESATADRVAAALTETAVPAEAGDVDAAVDRDPEIVVAADERGLVDLVEAGIAAPVLAVDADPGLPSVAPDDVRAAAGWIADGAHETRTHRLLAAEVADQRVGRALFDAMLVRSEPGRISEYGVAGGGERTRFRADGVVVATPAGSEGYARAVGGPRLAADAAAVAVVPVAAFALGADVLVVDPADGVRLSVERDDGSVALLLDGQVARTLTGRAVVDLSVDATLEFVVPPEV